jgi:hypothetical protein
MGEEESAASYGRVVEDVVKTNGYGQHHSGVFVDLEAPATTHQSNKEDSAAGGVVSNISSVERSSEEESDDQITPSASSCDHKHYSHRSPWLRAMVLGANDGLISIASLMLGVGAVNNDVKSMIVSGLAGLVAGACSMAIGEFVSVFSQRDSELADVEKERQVAKNNNNFKTISSIESWVFVLRFVHDHCHGPKKTFFPLSDLFSLFESVIT